MSSLITPFSKILNKEICSTLIDKFIVKEAHATIYDVKDQFYYHQFNMVNDPDFSVHCQDIMALCMNAVNYYCKHTCKYLQEILSSFDTISTFETPIIRKYPAGKGFINWHFDSSTYKSSRRFLAIVITLNDISFGGELEFKTSENRSKLTPQQGTLIISPTSFEYLHRELLPNEDKYVISTFALLPDTTKYITD